MGKIPNKSASDSLLSDTRKPQNASRQVLSRRAGWLIHLHGGHLTVKSAREPSCQAIQTLPAGKVSSACRSHLLPAHIFSFAFLEDKRGVPGANISPSVISGP